MAKFSNFRVTLSKQRNFVREGQGSAIFALATEGNTPLAATQADMTPMQRMVMIEGFKQQQEEMEAQQGGGGMRTNSAARPMGGGSGDVTTFVRQDSNE